MSPTIHEIDSSRGLTYTREALRRIDRIAVEELGIPSIVLMENAARGLAEVAREYAQSEHATGYVILAGPGSNGGDGLAAARHLAGELPLEIIAAFEADCARGDAAVHYRIATAMGVPITHAGESDAAPLLARAITRAGGRPLIIDALLGTGLTGPARGAAAALIAALEGARGRCAATVSADVPSGLDADTGEPLGPCVRATATVSFVGVKAGFLMPPALPWIGTVHCRGIGAPLPLVRRLGVPRAGR